LLTTGHVDDALHEGTEDPSSFLHCRRGGVVSLKALTHPLAVLLGLRSVVLEVLLDLGVLCCFDHSVEHVKDICSIA
jgi:hypothetical protein